MTVTRDQAQMLATLATACRPTGARRWDAAGVMAALEKLRERDLSEVVMATVRAARDRDVETPGVIPTPGSHWREQLAPLPFVANVIDRAERCSVCSLSEPACRIRWASDHEFRSAALAAKEAAAGDPAAQAVVIAALRDELAHTPRRESAAEGLDALADRNPELKARVDVLREANVGLREPPQQEPEPEPEPTTDTPGDQEVAVTATGTTARSER